MSTRILVPLDGSELSEKVFPWVKYLARHMAVEVELVRSFEPPGTIYLVPDLAVSTVNPFEDNQLGELVLNYLEEASRKLEDLGASTRMLVGDPATEILNRSKKFDLVLMASHGRGGLGRWLMGSVSSKISRAIEVPLMVVGARAIESERPVKVERVVVPVDGSAPSERAFDKAVEWARRFGAKVLLYHGVPQLPVAHQAMLEANQENMEAARQELEDLARPVEGVEVETHAREASGAPGIVDFAAEMAADLIVMGSYGKSGLVRWVLGSATERVLQQAHCPVLVTH